jgi:hypothetical protein
MISSNQFKKFAGQPSGRKFTLNDIDAILDKLFNEFDSDKNSRFSKK